MARSPNNALCAGRWRRRGVIVATDNRYRRLASRRQDVVPTDVLHMLPKIIWSEKSNCLVCHIKAFNGGVNHCNTNGKSGLWLPVNLGVTVKMVSKGNLISFKLHKLYLWITTLSNAKVAFGVDFTRVTLKVNAAGLLNKNRSQASDTIVNGVN